MAYRYEMQGRVIVLSDAATWPVGDEDQEDEYDEAMMCPFCQTEGPNPLCEFCWPLDDA